MPVRIVSTLFVLLQFLSVSHAATLLEAIHLAEVKDPNFAALRTIRSIADKTPDIARAALLPHIVLTASSSSAQLTQEPIRFAPNLPAVGGNTEYDSTEWGGRIIQPLFDWAAFQQYQSAKLQRSREQARADSKAQLLYLNTASTYFDVLRAQDGLSIAKSRLRTLDKRLEEAQEKFNVGMVSKIDVLEQESQRDTAASQLLSAEDQLNIQMENLTAIVGERLPKLAGLRDNLPVLAPTPNNIDAWGKLAVKQNPDVLASEFDIQQSEANHAAAQGGYLPQINLFASYTDRNLKGSNNASVALNSGTTEIIGVEARWEVFSGGVTNARVKQTSLQAALARQNHESDSKQIENQSRAIFMSVKTDASRIKAQQRSLASATLSFSAIEAGYAAGTHSIVDLMASETKLNNARVELTNARYDYIINCLRLYKIIGMLNESAITRINGWLAET